MLSKVVSDEVYLINKFRSQGLRKLSEGIDLKMYEPTTKIRIKKN